MNYFERGEAYMCTSTMKIAVALVATVALAGVWGCSKKAVQSGGDTQSSQQGAAKSGTAERSRSGVGSFPDTSMQSGGSSGLKGLDKNPSEERIGTGTVLAKADTSGSANRQLDEMRAE